LAPNPWQLVCNGSYKEFSNKFLKKLFNFLFFKNLKHWTTANEIQAHKIFQRSFHFSQILSNVIVLQNGWLDWFFLLQEAQNLLQSWNGVIHHIYKYHNIKYEDWRKISIFICFTNTTYILGLITLNYGKLLHSVILMATFFFPSKSLLNSLTKWTS